jgi:hypothetical protein
MEHGDLEVVATVNKAAEAEIIRAALEAVGINATISGETQAGLAGVLSIDVMAPVDQADHARKELRALRKEKKERHKARVEKRKAREADSKSEAIQELKPSDEIKKKPEQ